MKELLQQVRVIDPVSGTDKIADVLITDGAIAEVRDRISEYPYETKTYDCQGLVLGPGLVDLYSHSGEPGFEDRETTDSLLQAAAAGGFTRLAILPDTTPPVDNPAGLARLQQQTEQISQKSSFDPSAELQGIASSGHRRLSYQVKSQKSSPHLPISPSPHLPLLHYWGALTLSIQGQQMTELAELAAAGVVGLADGQPIANLALLRRLLEYLKPLEKPIALVVSDRQLASNGVMREGPSSLRLGLPGNPAISETAALAALLEVVATTGTPVHLMRVSCARSVELIAAAKAKGLPITASTTWMHLLLDTDALSSYNPNLRLEPPLGNPDDRTALIQGVKEGIVDAIAIDHAPYTYEEKTVAFAEAPPGAIGLELALPLLWQNLVVPGTWSALELWRSLSTAPSKCLQLPIRAIAPSHPAELTLFDPKTTWQVSDRTLQSRSANTPWLGQQLIGRVVRICLPL
ncbi:MAG: dihydroorotase [Cyanosarcina radialis HA8281-LM2]|nr:dihydroorotase [Cyanosarcina radialis HA8281-LM2]